MLGSNLWGNHFQSQLAPLRMAWRQGNVLQLWQRKALGSVKSRVLRRRYERCDAVTVFKASAKPAEMLPFLNTHIIYSSHTQDAPNTPAQSLKRMSRIPSPCLWQVQVHNLHSIFYMTGQKRPDEVSFSRGILSSRSSRMVKAPGSRPMKASKLATWQKVIRWSLSEATESTVLLCT